MEEKLRDLGRIRDALHALADACRGADGLMGDCPILDAMEDEEQFASAFPGD